jgi:DNA-binding NarL/FixJ family response regulator
METIKLLIADNHLIIRDGIKLMLKKNLEFEIVAEASNGSEAIDFIASNPNAIDVILMDINMPVMNGIEATQFITDHYPNINVLALTMHAEEIYIVNTIKAGALGYILKESGIDELIAAIKSVAAGDKYYSNDVSVTMINLLMNGGNTKASELSERETEVLSYIAVGSTSKEVGVKLHISVRTVETHRRNILAKLELKNTAEIVRYAIEHNIEAY